MNEGQTALNAEVIISLLNEAERKLPVSSWKINGLQLWPAIRLELYHRLSMHLVSRGYYASRKEGASVKKIVRSMVTFLKATFADYRKSYFRYKRSDALFLSDGTFFIKLNGLYYDKLFDPIISYMTTCGYTTYKLERGRNYLIPRFCPSRFIQPSIDLSLVKAKLRKKNVYEEHLPGLEGLQALLAPYAELVPDFTPEYLRKKSDTINALKKYFSGILKKSRPKLAFIASFYGDLGYAYITACKDNGVPVVDIQHGLQGPLHAAYGSWEKVPAAGYQFLPDYFWCWSASEYKGISQWANQTTAHRAVIGGNSLLEMWKRNEMPDSEYYSSLFKGIKERLKGRKTILHTLQYGLTGEAELAETLAAISETQHEYNWLIRLHPMMLEDMGTIKALLAKYNITNYNIEESTSAPLFAVLRQADLHITHSSSTVIEAVHFGIPSIITSAYGISHLSEEIESGWATAGLGAGEIVRKMAVLERSVLADGPSSSNMEQAIATIMAPKR